MWDWMFTVDRSFLHGPLHNKSHGLLTTHGGMERYNQQGMRFVAGFMCETNVFF